MKALNSEEREICSHWKWSLYFYYRSWLKRIPLLKTSEESAWLFHEIGRCYWEAGNYTEAKECGGKSLTAAEDSHDQFWQLNANMLIAQTEGK